MTAVAKGSEALCSVHPHDSSLGYGINRTGATYIRHPIPLLPAYTVCSTRPCRGVFYLSLTGDVVTMASIELLPASTTQQRDTRQFHGTGRHSFRGAAGGPSAGKSA